MTRYWRREGARAGLLFWHCWSATRAASKAWPPNCGPAAWAQALRVSQPFSSFTLPVQCTAQNVLLSSKWILLLHDSSRALKEYVIVLSPEKTMSPECCSSVTHVYKGKIEGGRSDLSLVQLPVLQMGTHKVHALSHYPCSYHTFSSKGITGTHGLLQSPVPRHTGQTQGATVDYRQAAGAAAAAAAEEGLGGGSGGQEGGQHRQRAPQTAPQASPRQRQVCPCQAAHPGARNSTPHSFP